MKRVFISAVIVVLLFVSGCGSLDVRNSSESAALNPTEQAEESGLDEGQSDEIKFGYSTESEDMDVYLYNGETLNVPFQLEVGKATGHDVGFLIFIGGVAQSYSVQYADGSVSEEGVMQRFKLSEEGKQTFSFLINPSVGKKGDKLGIYVCGMIYPSFQPDDVEQPSYQYYGSLSQVVPQQVKFEADSKNNGIQVMKAENGLDLTDEIINSIKMFSSEETEEILKGNLYGQLYQNSESEPLIESDNGKITLHLQLYGGVEGIYNTTIFINHEPVTIDGMDCIQSQMTANKMSVCEITLDISDYEYLNTIYAVTVPADDAYLDSYPAEKTNSRLLVNKLKQEG